MFSPYADNGGTIVAIAGDDYAIIASDTRLISGRQIFTRNQSKLFRLSDKTILGSSGCWCDVLSLTRLVQTRMKMYLYEHNKYMSTPAIAQMMSVLLYYKRFFPYYTSNIVAGLDNSGKGVVYSYDPIGHYQPSHYRAAGASGGLIQPLLDNQLGKKNQENVIDYSLPVEKALGFIKDVFISAAERDTVTGDSISIAIITKDGTKNETFELRKD